MNLLFAFYLWLSKLYGGNSGHTAGICAGLAALATMMVLGALVVAAVIGGLVYWAL